MQITEKQYQFALKRIEDLLPLVSDDDPNKEEAVELSINSEIVIIHSIAPGFLPGCYDRDPTANYAQLLVALLLVPCVLSVPILCG